MRETCDWKLFSDFGIHISYSTKSKFICLAISTLFISCYDVVHHRTIKPCVSVYGCYCEDNSSLGCGFWYTYQCWVFKLRSVVVYINHVYVYLSSENNAELRDDKRGKYGEPAIWAQDIWIYVRRCCALNLPVNLICCVTPVFDFKLILICSRELASW